jgi:hypothetical protein
MWLKPGKTEKYNRQLKHGTKTKILHRGFSPVKRKREKTGFSR